MVITTNTSLSVRTEIREALKNFNTNPFSTAGLHEDALNAEDEILMQISDQTKRVTLQDIGGYLNVTSSDSYTKAENNLQIANTSNYVSSTSNIFNNK